MIGEFLLCTHSLTPCAPTRPRSGDRPSGARPQKVKPQRPGRAGTAMLLILVVWAYIFVTSYLWGASLVRWAFPGPARDHDQPVLLSLVGLSMITVAAGLFST